jgi:L-malate glycosyltransferase
MNGSRNVLYVSHTPALKGSAVSLVQLMLGLDPTRFRPTVVFSKEGFLVDDLKSRGIATEVLSERGWLGWRLVRRAGALMTQAGVDLVHLNSAVPFCKYVGIAARMHGLPVVWHIREDPQGKRVRSLKKWIRWLADRVFVVSTELEQAFASFPVVKIYNGVNVDQFHPGITGTELRDRFGIPRDGFLFAMVGTIEERKGTLQFLSAADALLNAGRDAWFAVVGDGMAQDEQQVRDHLAERPRLSSRVVLPGRLDNIPQVMAGIDVLVMPSLWEGFPRSLIEAMASGKAAVASDTGEVPYIIQQGLSGTVVPRGDLLALIEAMAGCMSRREHLSEMGKRARERVLSEFTIQKHVECVQKQYAELLGPRLPGRGSSQRP